MIQQLDLDEHRLLKRQEQLHQSGMQKVIAIDHDSVLGDVYWSELGQVSYI